MGAEKIGAAPKQQGWMDTLKQAMGPNQYRSTPWTPPDIALDPIRALLMRLMGGGGQAPPVQGPAIGNPGQGHMYGGPDAAIGAPGQGRMLGGPGASIGAPGRGRMLGGPDARIGAPKASPVSAAAVVPKSARRRQLKGAANPKNIDDRMARAAVQMAGTPMQEFDDSVGQLGNFSLGISPEELVGAQQPPLESSNLGVDQLAPSIEGQAPPAARKQNAILKALMMGLGR